MFGVEETRLSGPRIERVRQAKKQIEEHVAALAEEMRQGKSDRLERFLTYFAQFHQYSLGNVILAVLQRPDITHLAGLRQWNKLGRVVKAGEKGIMILAPVTVRRKDMETENGNGPAEGEDEERGDGRKGRNGSPEKTNGDTSKNAETVLFFKPVYVFDESQTSGAPLPSLIHAHGEAEKLWPALKRRVTQSALIKLEFVDTIQGSPTARGVSMGGRIQLRKDLEGADAVRVLIHEYAHEILAHRSSANTRQVRETEADATAYVVCRHFGIVTDSADYLLLYDAKPELVYNRLETIRDAAHWIISGVEEDLEWLAQFS